jgi:hypothetical protein
MRGILRRAVLVLFGPFILCGKLERPTDLLNEACEFFRGLGGDSLDVSLKDEKVLGFDENVVLYESFVIRSVGDSSFVELVLRSPGRRYAAFMRSSYMRGWMITYVL